MKLVKATSSGCDAKTNVVFVQGRMNSAIYPNLMQKH